MPKTNFDKRGKEEKLWTDLLDRLSLPDCPNWLALRLLGLAVNQYDGLPSHMRQLQWADIHFQSIKGEEKRDKVEEIEDLSEEYKSQEK